MGFLPSIWAVWLIWRTAWCALSTVSVKRQADVACLALKLGQDGVAKGFGGDAGAVGEQKNTVRLGMGCSLGGAWLSVSFQALPGISTLPSAG